MTADLRRLIDRARTGDPRATTELARLARRRNDPWGATLAVRADLYAAARHALDALEAAAVALRSGLTEPLDAAWGRTHRVAETVTALTRGTTQPSAKRLASVVACCARVCEAWCVRERVDLGTGAPSTCAVEHLEREATGARAALAAASSAPRKREAHAIAALARRAATWVELAEVVCGGVGGLIRHLDPALWWRDVIYDPHIVVADRWERHWDYEAMLRRGLDPTSFREISEALLRHSGRVDILDERGVAAVRLDARVLRKGWLKALVERHSAMGSYVRDLARTSWDRLWSEIPVDDDLALDALRRSLGLWRREEDVPA